MADQTKSWVLNAVWGVLLALGLMMLNGINDNLRDLNNQIRDLNRIVVNGLASLDKRVAILEHNAMLKVRDKQE